MLQSVFRSREVERGNYSKKEDNCEKHSQNDGRGRAVVVELEAVFTECPVISSWAPTQNKKMIKI